MDIVMDSSGLVVVVAQERSTGEIRMVAWANREALERTLATGEAYFYSRSRRALWKKGETSGHVLRVASVWTDCDRDAIVYLVDAEGPSCHTGEPSCFFAPLSSAGDARRALPELAALGEVIAARRESTGEKSYTRSLFDGGAPKIGAKLREEAGELADALASETDARVVSECADLVYHAMVGLASRGLDLGDVARELARRAGTSGHVEKASR